MTDQEMKEIKMLAFAMIYDTFKKESKEILENMKIIINGILHMEKKCGQLNETENVVSCVYGAFEEFAIRLKYEPMEYNKKEL